MRERPRPEYISKERASKILGICHRTFTRLASEGHFATIAIPGTPTRYRAADVEAFKARCETPALAGAAEVVA